MKATFAKDNRKPGSYLARVEVSGTEPWPDIGSVIELRRKDDSMARVELGDPVWSGPDSEKDGVEVTLYRITKSLDEKTGRQPPKRAKPKS